MKLISLNIWGGHVYEPLIKFIDQNKEMDIFCFQEVYHNAHRKISTEEREHDLNIFSKLQHLLPCHRGIFRSVVDNIYGICLFVNKKIDVIGDGEIMIHENLNYPGAGPTHSRNLQWLKFKVNKQFYYVLNVHGLWNGMGKTDSFERIEQSQKIKNFMDTLDLDAKKILCGDFNLKPDTESMAIIEKGMTNLIKTFNVMSTRTKLYPKDEKFADYILVSTNISVNKFEVLEDEVSDHAPLYLDFL